jgi:hypothetical protein
MKAETRSTSTERVRAHRKRRRHGICRRTISLGEAQLDALEKKGYLDPYRRGEPADECDAIETFIMDSLLKP